MIRINLLPFRAAKRRENIRRQVSLFVLSVLLLLSAMAWVGLSGRAERQALQLRKEQLQKELAEHAQVARQLAELRNRIKELHAKLDVIERLDKTRKGPVALLQQIAWAVPKDRLWLESLEEKAGRVVLKGTAMDHNTVALFMSNLEKSALFASVDLHSTRLRELPAHKIQVSDFVLSCHSAAAAAVSEGQQPPTAGKG